MSDHSNRPASFVVRPVGAAASLLLTAAATRRNVVIGPPAAGDIWIGPTQGVAVGNGLRLGTGMPPLKLCCCDLGRLITESWYAVAATPTEQIAVVESFAAADED